MHTSSTQQDVFQINTGEAVFRNPDTAVHIRTEYSENTEPI